MWFIIIPLIFGYIFAAYKPAFVQKCPIDWLINISLVLLLFVMGARIGVDEEVLEQIFQLGSFALLIAIFAILGSVLFLLLIDRVSTKYARKRNSKSGKTFITTALESKPDKKETGPEMSNQTIEGLSEDPHASNNELDRRIFTLMLTASVLVGGIAGLLFLPKILLPWLTELTTWILGLLLLGVGLDLGISNTVTRELKKYGLTILLFPIGVALGSVVGGIAYNAIAGSLTWNEAAALASGFGWYSLSAVIISEAHTPILGATAFLANIFRELLAILTIPLVAKFLGGIAALAPGGATTMDVTLPVISKAAGKAYVPLAFFTGAILSLLVPVFVNFFLNL